MESDKSNFKVLSLTILIFGFIGEIVWVAPPVSPILTTVGGFRVELIYVSESWIIFSFIL